MANYIVRPELKGDPSRISYLRLHALMGSRGFLMQAEGQDLPHATYFGASDKSADDLSSELLNLIRQDIQYEVIVAAAQTEHVSVNGQTGAFSFGEQLSRFRASDDHRSALGINHLTNLASFWAAKNSATSAPSPHKA